MLHGASSLLVLFPNTQKTNIAQATYEKITGFETDEDAVLDDWLSVYDDREQTITRYDEEIR